MLFEMSRQTRKRRRGKPKSLRELSQILRTNLNSLKIAKRSPDIFSSLPKERKKQRHERHFKTDWFLAIFLKPTYSKSPTTKLQSQRHFYIDPDCRSFQSSEEETYTTFQSIGSTVLFRKKRKKGEQVHTQYSYTPKIQKPLPRHQENAIVKENSRSNRQTNIQAIQCLTEIVPKKQTTI